MTCDWEPKQSISDDTIHLDDLKISFHRTVRVPDSQNPSALPPSLGHFPLFKVKDFLGKLPYEMSAKGGIFMPMYQREAMWINFRSKQSYAIKVYVGGINAVSGEPMIENAATRLRRQTLMQQGKTIQDYVVVPEQRWMDGIATGSGQVRQFVAMPVGSGYSIEMQMTGEEVTGGLQFDITPIDPDQIRLTINGRVEYHVNRRITVEAFRRMLERDSDVDFGPRYYIWYGNAHRPEFLIHDLHKTLSELGIKDGGNIILVSHASWKGKIFVKTLGDGCYEIDCESEWLIADIMEVIEQTRGVPVNQQRLIFKGRELESGKQGCTLHFVLRLRGGGPPEPKPESSDQPEMGIAAGGIISQFIFRDPGRLWHTSATKTFNVQILNSAHFRRVTGNRPPKTPITSKTYAQLGYPFYTTYEEPSNIFGVFANIKSIGKVDGFFEPEVHHRLVSLFDKGKSSRYPRDKENKPKHSTKGKERVSEHHQAESVPTTRGFTREQMEKLSQLRTQVGFWNPERPAAEFRDVKTMEREVKAGGPMAF